MFDRYRNLDVNQDQANSFADCARLFNDCKAAEKYNENNDDEVQDDEDHNIDMGEEEDSTNGAEDTNATESNLESGSDSTQNGQNHDFSRSETKVHSRSVERFILRRASNDAPHN
jgi:hypothetical protein